MPESGDHTYQVQYGRTLNFSGSGVITPTLRVPAGIFTSVTLQALVSDLPSNAAFSLDVGATGSPSWSTTVGNNTENTSPNLAAYFNAYWASHGAPTTGTLDVPIRVTLDRAGQVLLTNLQVTPTGSKTRALRLPVRPQGYSSVTANFTVSGGTGPLAVGLDVGDNGSIDWTYTGSPTYPASLTVQGPAFTAAINAYLAAAGGQSAADVPLRVYLAPFATLSLTGLSATPVGETDAGLGAGDIAFSSATPMETDMVTIDATLHNPGSLDSGPLTAAFYALRSTQYADYIGSAFIGNVAATSADTVSLQWNTTGFTGAVPVRVVIDPYNRVAEANEANNVVTATVTIRTRPDLRIASITPTDPEPVAGQPVTVTLAVSNTGQTAAGASTLALYDGHPDAGGALICESALSVPGEDQAAPACAWTPTTPGSHRLLARADRDGQVNESDKGNNDRWLDVYVGFGGAILLDSGAGATYDPPIKVDDNSIGAAVDLSDGKAHRLSFRLDPAFYADRSITVSVEELTGYDAVVAEINLYDVDYRYADSGRTSVVTDTADPLYPVAPPGRPERRYGWLDGVDNRPVGWGTLPYQTRRIDLGDSDPSDNPDNELRYRFDGLRPGLRYQLHLTFYQKTGGLVQQSIAVDDIGTGAMVELNGLQRVDKTVDVPPGAYASDGSIIVKITRTNATAAAFVNEIALEELTLLPEEVQQVTQSIGLHSGGPNWFSFNVKPAVRPAAACTGVNPTAAFTTVYGDALLAGAVAPTGSLIEAYSPGGVKVGCVKVVTPGLYEYMRVYGAEGATPGLTAGQPILFKINGIAAQPTPHPVVWADDRATRAVDLSAADVIPVETLLSTIAGHYSRLACEGGTYLPPPADPRFNTCTTLAGGQGYLLYASVITDLVPSGVRLATDTPLPLHAGWNWLGYLPTCELPVATALAGLAGSYDILHSEAGTYRPPPANPAYNNFSTMAPDRGYMIHVSAAVTLTYPAGLCGAAVQEAPHTPPATDCPALATGRFTTFYGQVTPGASPVPVAAPVRVYTPRDEVVGCGQTHADGSYGYLRVYGADGDLPGAQPGEPLRFTVAGVTALAAAVPTWIDDFGVQRLDLTLAAQPLYLPLLRREGARP